MRLVMAGNANSNANPKKSSTPFLARAETEVMRILWAKGAATVHDVVEELERPLAYTTVLTMLRVLEQKGYVSHEPSPEGGRAHVYRPTVTQAGARKSHLQDLVDRLFGGKADLLMVGLLRDERWSRAELRQLRAEIDAKLAAKQANTKRNGGR
jgi:BlaI family penicillinase repressor